MGKDITVPVEHSNLQCTITPPWFVNGSEYRPVNGSFELLINGENAFRAVHQAIAGAQKSVSIICWGFQPSMYFIRDGRSPSIGELLALKAEQGVVVRVLSWALDPSIVLDTPINVTGAPPLEESNTPGRWDTRIKAKPPTSTDRQYNYDVWWYQQYDENQEIEDELAKKLHARFGNKKSKNIHFTSRGFSNVERFAIANQKFDDKGLTADTKVILGTTPSHHQKTVVVDHEDPALAIGFVMGHNMLDEYWDTSDHSAKRRVLLKTGHPDQAPNTGPNGKFPRHDFSSRLTGPIIGDVFSNFAVAWQKETNETLPLPKFTNYSVRSDRSAFIMGQILRTQKQYGVEDIKKGYLQAVNNASRFIHIENQYFRWPPLAEKIKECAARMNQCGRSPEAHGPLYLFAITNSTDLGVGAGTVNTYRMMDSLGRADAIPALARDERARDLDAELGKATAKRRLYEEQKDGLDNEAEMLKGISSIAASLTKRYEDINAKIAAAKAYEDALKNKKEALGTEKNPVIPMENRPGLKCLIGTLVAPDTADGEPWIEVYIHGKLMTIDDAFLTLGSANINTRSMEVDSEMNIIHEREIITQAARRALWEHHTNGRGAQDDPGEAFDWWEKIMKKNSGVREKKLKPIAPLAAFLRMSAKRSNLD